MLEQIKEYFIIKYIYHIFALVFALGLLPLIIIFVGLGESPEWIDIPEHHLDNAYAVTVTQEMPISGNVQEDALKTKAIRRIGDYIIDIALEQMLASYGVDHGDHEEIAKMRSFLDGQLLTLPEEMIIEQDTYKDDSSSKRYGLYSIDRDDMNVWLQGVYETYNRQRLDELGY